MRHRTPVHRPKMPNRLAGVVAVATALAVGAPLAAAGSPFAWLAAFVGSVALLAVFAGVWSDGRRNAPAWETHAQRAAAAPWWSCLAATVWRSVSAAVSWWARSGRWLWEMEAESASLRRGGYRTAAKPVAVLPEVPAGPAMGAAQAKRIAARPPFPVQRPVADAAPRWTYELPDGRRWVWHPVEGDPRGRLTWPGGWTMPMPEGLTEVHLEDGAAPWWAGPDWARWPTNADPGLPPALRVPDYLWPMQDPNADPWSDAVGEYAATAVRADDQVIENYLMDVLGGLGLDREYLRCHRRELRAALAGWAVLVERFGEPSRFAWQDGAESPRAVTVVGRASQPEQHIGWVYPIRDAVAGPDTVGTVLLPAGVPPTDRALRIFANGPDPRRADADLLPVALTVKQCEAVQRLAARDNPHNDGPWSYRMREYAARFAPEMPELGADFTRRIV